MKKVFRKISLKKGRTKRALPAKAVRGKGGREKEKEEEEKFNYHHTEILQKKLPKVVAKRYVVRKLLGAGSFGCIYSAYDAKTKNECAIKFELLKSKYPQLFCEKRVYDEFQNKLKQFKEEQRLQKQRSLQKTTSTGPQLAPFSRKHDLTVRRDSPPPAIIEIDDNVYESNDVRISVKTRRSQSISFSNTRLVKKKKRNRIMGARSLTSEEDQNVYAPKHDNESSESTSSILEISDLLSSEDDNSLNEGESIESKGSGNNREKKKNKNRRRPYGGSRYFYCKLKIKELEKFYDKNGIAIGVPRIFWYGIEKNFNALVMDKLGPSLEDLFNFCSRKFSLKTSFLIMDQLISRIEFVHSLNYIHRDIKPENFLLGSGRMGGVVYCVDFGLAKKYYDEHFNRHIKMKKNKSLTGTARYTSINSHLGIEQSRRDDLESIGYVIVYFLKGELPWQGISAETKEEKYKKILIKKLSVNIDKLCRGVPAQLAKYFIYVKKMKFEQKPNYDYLRKLIRSVLKENNVKMDLEFDWIKLKKELYLNDDVRKFVKTEVIDEGNVSTISNTPE